MQITHSACHNTHYMCYPRIFSIPGLPEKMVIDDDSAGITFKAKPRFNKSIPQNLSFSTMLSIKDKNTEFVINI